MFLVWGMRGESTVYVPGAIRSRRRVERIDRVAAPQPVAPHDSVPPVDRPSDVTESYASRVYRQVADGVPERRPAIAASQILESPVVSLTPDASVAEAWEIFRDRRFRHVPVVNVTGRIVGILSDRDLLRETGRAALSRQADSAFSETRVEQVMTTEVLTAHPDTPIREIARVFFEERIGAAPIVDDRDELVGIITRSDILRTIMHHAPIELWL